ncbi:hypothetical protein JOB18_042767 [Solea senegalensis]|uniref:Uncharacterized protein n=1 Tax=Solea senegalensis TaxID=28829 RepID=A0AAV6PJJ8_SOLSE|nr:hypothetical protein JOB18_042767 [Solea senegalensis]
MAEQELREAEPTILKAEPHGTLEVEPQEAELHGALEAEPRGAELQGALEVEAQGYLSCAALMKRHQDPVISF